MGDAGELTEALVGVGLDAADDFVGADFGERHARVVPVAFAWRGAGVAVDSGPVRVVCLVGAVKEPGAPGEISAQLVVVHIPVSGVLPAEDAVPVVVVAVVGHGCALQVEVEGAAERHVAESVVGADGSHAAQAGG